MTTLSVEICRHWGEQPASSSSPEQARPPGSTVRTAGRSPQELTAYSSTISWNRLPQLDSRVVFNSNVFWEIIHIPYNSPISKCTTVLFSMYSQSCVTITTVNCRMCSSSDPKETLYHLVVIPISPRTPVLGNQTNLSVSTDLLTLDFHVNGITYLLWMASFHLAYYLQESSMFCTYQYFFAFYSKYFWWYR